MKRRPAPDQFGQMRKDIYRKLLVVAQTGRRKAFNILAEFCLYSPHSIEGAHRLVSFQNTSTTSFHGANFDLGEIERHDVD